MNSGTHQENTRFLRLATFISMVSSAVSVLLLFKLNGIVHGQLYDFGLQFSLLWASPYWDTERLIYACLAIPPIVGGLALIHSFLKASRNRIRVTRKVETKPTANLAPAKTARTDSSMIITCPKCRRGFGRPLNMLDFSKGNARLVNVCPYCNYVLGSAVDEDSESTRVILPDKTEIEQK